MTDAEDTRSAILHQKRTRHALYASPKDHVTPPTYNRAFEISVHMLGQLVILCHCRICLEMVSSHFPVIHFPSQWSGCFPVMLWMLLQVIISHKSFAKSFIKFLIESRPLLWLFLPGVPWITWITGTQLTHKKFSCCRLRHLGSFRMLQTSRGYFYWLCMSTWSDLNQTITWKTTVCVFKKR